ncbi:MAG: hypothetical protein K9J81_10435 [Desulfohalobiaceae bacterium]|nr:hypothetical protein [Desulfohalobiaceae bacterium]
MKLNQLLQIQKLYFGHEELARALGITRDSARVTASRYVKQGLLVRIRNNLYMLREKWKYMDREDAFQIANLGQVPSYISLTTALDYFGLTTQLQRDFFESIALKRTKEIKVESTIFTYRTLSPYLYFGFQKKQNFFIADPEKALLDALYLMSLSRYSLDLSAIEPHKLDQKLLANMSTFFPLRTRKLLHSHEYLPAA